MDKYVGKYRVACMFTYDGVANKDETFIVCNSGGQIYRVDDRNDVLAYYHPKSRFKLKKKLSEAIVCTSWSDDETVIMFQEKDLEKVIEIVGVPKSGKDIPPHYKTNMRFTVPKSVMVAQSSHKG